VETVRVGAKHRNIDNHRHPSITSTGPMSEEEKETFPIKDEAEVEELASSTDQPIPAAVFNATIMVPPTSNTSTATLESFLQTTLFDLHIRAEVEATLQDLITDVEFAVNLQEQLSIRTHQNKTERIIAEQELALEETHVVQKDRLQLQTLLADAFVKDLWSLSKEVGSLLELKQKHEAMVLEYDELVAKLAQAEEDLNAALSRPQASQTRQAQPSATVVAIPKETPPTVVDMTKKPAASDTAAPAKTVASEKVSASASLKSEVSSKAAAAAQNSSKPDDAPGLAKKPSTDSTIASIPSMKSDKEKKAPAPESSAPAPVVALVEDDQEQADEPPVTLETIDMEILMRIFGYLDAYDILNTAQVNISMYSRVDSLFGFGMDAPVQDDNVSTTSTLATTPTVAAATQPPPSGATATTASLSTNSTRANPKPAPAPVSVPAPAAAASSKQAEPQFGHRIVGGGRGLLNLLGGARVGDAGGADSKQQQQQSPKEKRGGRGRGSSDADSKPPLSEAMAHSMAAKLNDAEINAIISMTEKLRSKEKQVALLIKEKEELEGKLNGSEAVKDFLISKVRDMEKIMNKSDETEKKVTQQIASDQEVIAFLDGRVQELERATRVVQKEKNATQEKLKSVIAQNDKKVAVLSDMLQFERQKLKENEREWKATKKLLVKEVKGCRAQIVALQAERDGFREQNDALRKAVMAGGGSSSNGRASSPHR
jgi:hypothetical protein